MIIDRQMFEDWRRKPAGEMFELVSVLALNEILFEKIWRSITSFLNTSGGTMVLIIPDQFNAHELAERITMGVDMEISPRPTVEVSVFDVEPGKNDFRRTEVVVVEVPVGYEKPYSRKSQILIRKGESIQVASRPEILTLLGEHEDPGTRWERQLVPGATEADLNLEKIHECLAREDIGRSIYNLRQTRDDSPIWSFLRYFNLGKQSSLRNGAIVLFGRSPFSFFPQTAIRVVAYFAEEPEAAGIADEKTLSRNLFENIDDCLYFCERHIVIASRFPTSHEKTFQRGQEVGFPFAALREAILNALVHRDFTSFDSNVTIKISPLRIEIWNPGTFPTGADLNRLEDFRVSRPRNPDIAHVLQRMGYIERLGSGINRIIKLFENHGLPRPRWEEVGGGVRLTLMASSEERSRTDLLARKMVSQLEDGEVLSKKRLVSLLGATSDEAGQLIEVLCNLGVLQPVKNDLYKFRAGRI